MTPMEKLLKALNKAYPYRAVNIKNEYGIRHGKIILPSEEYMIDWIKDNDQGSSSFNHTHLSRLYRGTRIEGILAIEEYVKSL